MIVCFKKGADSFFDWAIRLRTLSKYVHSELLFSDGATWRIEPGDQPSVHFETGVVYDNANWDKIFIDVEEDMIRAWCVTQVGKNYDWVGILNFIAPFGENDDNDLFCSEGCTLALQQVGMLKTVTAKLVSPGALYNLLTVHASVKAALRGI